MRKSTFAMVLAVMFIAVTALTVAAQGAPGGPAGSPSPPPREAMPHPGGPPGEFAGGPHFRPSLEALQKKLGITDDQKKQMRALYTGFSDRTRKTRTELMALKDEKRTMMMSGKIDQQKLAQLDDQMVKLGSDVIRERLKLKRDRLAIMTPEQIEKLADLKAMKAFQSKFGKMRREHRKGHFEG